MKYRTGRMWIGKVLKVQSLVDATVVTEEKNQRVIRLPEVLERLHQPPDRSIDALESSEVDRSIRAYVSVSSLSILVRDSVRSDHDAMDHMVRQVAKPRPVTVARNELDRLVREFRDAAIGTFCKLILG
jgi:hypothetical protein